MNAENSRSSYKNVRRPKDKFHSTLFEECLKCFLAKNIYEKSERYVLAVNFEGYFGEQNGQRGTN